MQKILKESHSNRILGNRCKLSAYLYPYRIITGITDRFDSICPNSQPSPLHFFTTAEETSPFFFYPEVPERELWTENHLISFLQNYFGIL